MVLGCLCRPRKPSDTGVYETPPQVVRKSKSCSDDDDGVAVDVNGDGPPQRIVYCKSNHDDSNDLSPYTVDTNTGQISSFIRDDSAWINISAITYENEHEHVAVPRPERKSCPTSTTKDDANNNNVKVARRSYPVFHNKHPVQDKVRAKMALIENAFKQQTTTDVTESTTAEEEDADNILYDTSKNHRHQRTYRGSVVDCFNDPYEYAYKVWYRKGLLEWRPKSEPPLTIDQKQKFNSKRELLSPDVLPIRKEEQDASTIAPDVLPKYNEQNSPNENVQSNILKSSNDKNNEEVVVLRNYRSNKAQKCAACGKVVATIVNCKHCKEQTYCSIFCRGQDRYKHACINAPKREMKTTATTTQNNYDENSSPASSPCSKSPVILGFSPDVMPSRNRSLRTSGQVPMVSLFSKQQVNNHQQGMVNWPSNN